jgi:putative serine protease PepD
VFLPAIDRRPEAIVRPHDVDHVRQVIDVAREGGLELAVRSGGHSPAGHGVSEGGIVLDLARLKALELDPSNRVAWAETGLTAGEFTIAAAEHGLGVSFGDTGSVGIGGLTLGGGVGYLVRKHGLTIDSLLAAEVVTADGRVLRVDDDRHPELFWAIRGGGGNFGVATRLLFRLHEVDSVTGGMLVLPASAESSPSVVQIEDQRGLGSGIVLDSAGDIVTNNHVVSGASSFTVTASNGKRYRATLVGSFPPDDLAVIRVSGARLEPAVFADSSKLEVGDIAIAIGNPLGLRSSVTQGIVSAFRQAVPEGGDVTLPSVIQTSAAINPGNSGGALVDIQGRVIGIPTLAAIDPELGGSAPGIGFAIPSQLVKDIAGQIVAHGKVVNSHRAFLGIRVGDTNGNGVIVGAVTPGGAAARAGMRVGEAILSVDGMPTPNVDALSAVLARLKPGLKVPVVVEHQDGRKTTLHATLGTYPGS